MDRLLLLGLNHGTAPLEVREKLALSSVRSRQALEALRRQFPAGEFVLLSTCNRVEIYCSRPAHGQPRPETLIEFLASFHGLDASGFQGYLYQKAERQVVDHLFTVAASLDSMVLGETQILGQVRQAYDAARELSATGTMLNPLFQRAIAVGKQVMNQTSLSEGRMSIASVAVDYARGIFDDFADKTVLSIGAGKMAALVLKHIAELAPGRLLVANRTPEKAAALAGALHAQIVPFQQIGEYLAQADIVISSTGSSAPIITRAAYEKFLKARRYRPVFLIDIAMPRDIEAAVGKMDNVYLYNLDDLQKVVSSTQSQRKEAIEAARRIVRQQVDEFAMWHRTREMGPLIDALFRRAHRLAQEELARTIKKLPNISLEEKAHMDELARRIVNKLLHDPISNLRQAEPAHGSMTAYLNVMEKLFDLGSEGAGSVSDEGDDVQLNTQGRGDEDGRGQ